MQEPQHGEEQVSRHSCLLTLTDGLLLLVRDRLPHERWRTVTAVRCSGTCRDMEEWVCVCV